MWIDDSEMDEPLTLDIVAECVGTRRSLLVRLVEQGLIETIEPGPEVKIPRRAILRLRRMQRLRKDLGVNFTGAAIILDLLGRLERLRQELERKRDLD